MLLIKNGYILENNHKKYQDILIEDGKIIKLADCIEQNCEIIDAGGCLVTAGFIDVHVHLREPGFEYKETIESGTKAAAKGGYTCVMPMPNLKPAPDCVEHLKIQLDSIEKNAKIKVFPYATITKGEKGEELADIEELSKYSIFAYSDDGVGVQTASMMYEAMKLASKVNKPVVAHCEDNTLIYKGVMHDGVKSKELNLPGIPSICEAVQIARDVLLAEKANCHYHVCHVSSLESVRVIRDAKKAGIHVTAEVTPHHLLCCDEDIPADNGLWKMNPPLRSKEDKKALIEALIDGTIDIIATDHAPHSNKEKECGFMEAKFGIVGLETAFAQLYTELVLKGVLSLQQLLDAMNTKVADTFQLPFGYIKEGMPADITIINLDKQYRIDRSTMESKSNNTPFEGQEVYGVIEYTICDGKIAWRGKDV